MMHRRLHTVALFAGAFGLAVAMAVPSSVAAQQHKRLHKLTHNKVTQNKLTQRLPRKVAIRRADFALTYSGEAAKLSSSYQTNFWLNGGGVDGAVTFYGDLGFAGSLSALDSHNISNGTSLAKTTLVFGPRFTRDTTRWTDKCVVLKKTRRSDVFAEALFGFSHGFDGRFPEGTSTVSSANSSAMQIGVGADITIWRNFGLRVFQLDYIRTALPNGASNSQNDLRLSFGVTYSWNAPAASPKTVPKATPSAGQPETQPDTPPRSQPVDQSQAPSKTHR